MKKFNVYLKLTVFAHFDLKNEILPKISRTISKNLKNIATSDKDP